jgi:ubiquinone/menaquinone biosynthesis C-methylase UbiE
MAKLGDDFARRLLIDAGIAARMRVLDIGCGAGDMALVAAELVGEQGEVVGVDREAGPLVTGRDRARERRLSNVTKTRTLRVRPGKGCGPILDASGALN